MDAAAILEHLWTDYAAITPQAPAIHRLLADRGETVVNDHIAFRTFADPRLGIDRLAAPFVAAGWRPADTYVFTDKKLDARHYTPPDPTLPKLFISELRLHDCSPALQRTVQSLLDPVPSTTWQTPIQALLGRPWSTDSTTVEALRTESEYAAWLAAHGLRANHFTVLLNALTTIPDLETMVTFLQSHQFKLNAAGGTIIKGSAGEGLEQCSTIADRVLVEFTDGTHAVPGCYYEFARRHRTGDGRLFDKFIEGSADKIFESTDRGAARR